MQQRGSSNTKRRRTTQDGRLFAHWLSPRLRSPAMDSPPPLQPPPPPVNWDALDALVLDFVRSDRLVVPPASPSSSSSTTATSSSSPSTSSSSSYRSRLLIRRARRALEAGDVDDALALLRAHAPAALRDHRLLFHLHKQRFVELVRWDTEADTKTALDCLRTALAPCALDAYPNGVLGSNFKPCSGFMLKTTPKVRCSSLRVRASIASSPQKQYPPTTPAAKSEEEVRIAVLGASGYTGAEIVRLLANHPQFRIKVITADRKAGEQFGSVFPHLITQDLPNLVAIKDADFSNVDVVFCCLPHGTTQEIIQGLPQHLKIVDLYAVSFMSVASLIISGLLVGGAIVAVHGAFRMPEDLFLDGPSAGSNGNPTNRLLSFLALPRSGV